jgi:hypothetical protein
MLCNIDEENESYIYESQWLNVCRTRLETFENRLTLDDVIAEDEAIQASIKSWIQLCY